MSDILKNDGGSLSVADRHEEILRMLRQVGSVPVAALAERLGVSEVTIRKDLTILERKNVLYRTHGSAVLVNPYINDRHVNEKEKQASAEKQAIGRLAASLIIPNDTILIASGTTMMALAREIVPQGRLTAITAAVNVAMILARSNDIDIIQLGGLLRNSSVSAVGPYAESMLANFYCSKLFLGVDGIDPGFGITTTNLMEAKLNRVMMQSVQEVVVLADSSKFGRKGFAKICDMSSVHHVITDSNIPDRAHHQLTEMGIEISIANV